MPVFGGGGGGNTTVTYFAFNTSTNRGQTGDGANHTLKVVKDGTEQSVAGAITEVDSANLPGLYNVVLSSSNTAANFLVLGGISSTANVIIQPLFILTTVASQAPIASIAVVSVTGHTSILASGSGLASEYQNATSFLGNFLTISSGTGAFQSERQIIAQSWNAGTSQFTLTLDAAWATDPDSTSVLAISSRRGPLNFAEMAITAAPPGRTWTTT